MGFFTIVPKTDPNDVIFDQDIMLIHDGAVAPQSASTYARSLSEQAANPNHVTSLRTIATDLGHATSLWASNNADPAKPEPQETALARQIHTTLLKSPVDGTVTPQSGTCVTPVTLRDLRLIRDAVELSVQNGKYTDNALAQASAFIDTYNSLVLKADPASVLLYTCVCVARDNADKQVE